jgi:cytochrome c oxidase subunit 2
MRNQSCSAGSTTVAALLAILLILLTFGTFYYFVAGPWQFPEAINADGREIDAQFMRTLVITGVVFVASQLALAWVVFRYRGRGQRAHYSHGNNTMEVLWTTATAVFFIGLGFYARGAWAEMYFRGAAPGAVQIEVTAQQFAWNFRYPGPDGRFGRVDPKFISDSGGNPVGIDPDDPAGKDDIVSPVVAVPMGREIELILRAKDVTHSLWVRELRFKQDLVPGLVIRSHFTAEKTGVYEIACAELCGLGHHRMRSDLTVLPQADYEKWLQEQAAMAMGQ